MATMAAIGKVICQPLTGDQGKAICQPLATTDGKAICQPLAFDELDGRRRRHGVSAAMVIREARLHPKTWLHLTHGGAVRETTLRKIAIALDGLIANAPPRRPPAAIAGLVNAVEALLLQELAPNGVRNAALLMRINPRLGGKPNAALLPSRVHAMALYLVSVELQIANVEIARALNSSRENVRKLRPIIEDLRDDAEVEALFARVTAKLMGEAA